MEQMESNKDMSVCEYASTRNGTFSKLCLPWGKQKSETFQGELTDTETSLEPEKIQCI